MNPNQQFSAYVENAVKDGLKSSDVINERGRIFREVITPALAKKGATDTDMVNAQARWNQTTDQTMQSFNFLPKNGQNMRSAEKNLRADRAVLEAGRTGSQLPIIKETALTVGDTLANAFGTGGNQMISGAARFVNDIGENEKGTTSDRIANFADSNAKAFGKSASSQQVAMQAGEMGKAPQLGIGAVQSMPAMALPFGVAGGVAKGASMALGAGKTAATIGATAGLIAGHTQNYGEVRRGVIDNLQRDFPTAESLQGNPVYDQKLNENYNSGMPLDVARQKAYSDTIDHLSEHNADVYGTAMTALDLIAPDGALLGSGLLKYLPNNKLTKLMGADTSPRLVQQQFNQAQQTGLSRFLPDTSWAANKAGLGILAREGLQEGSQGAVGEYGSQAASADIGGRPVDWKKVGQSFVDEAIVGGIMGAGMRMGSGHTPNTEARHISDNIKSQTASVIHDEAKARQNLSEAMQYGHATAIQEAQADLDLVQQRATELKDVYAQYEIEVPSVIDRMINPAPSVTPTPSPVPQAPHVNLSNREQQQQKNAERLVEQQQENAERAKHEIERTKHEIDYSPPQAHELLSLGEQQPNQDYGNSIEYESPESKSRNLESQIQFNDTYGLEAPGPIINIASIDPAVIDHSKLPEIELPPSTVEEKPSISSIVNKHIENAAQQQQNELELTDFGYSPNTVIPEQSQDNQSLSTFEQPVSTADAITHGVNEIAKGMDEGTREQVAQYINEGKTDRLTYRKDDAIQAALNNPNYNVQQNEDGSVTVVGVKTADNVWHGIQNDGESNVVETNGRSDQANASGITETFSSSTESSDRSSPKDETNTQASASIDIQSFRERLLNAHLNDPNSKTKIINDEIATGRPRHEVLAEVSKIIDQHNRNKKDDDDSGGSIVEPTSPKPNTPPPISENIQNGDIGRKSDGLPFANQGAAKSYQKKNSLEDTHDIIQVGKGTKYVLRPKTKLPLNEKIVNSFTETQTHEPEKESADPSPSALLPQTTPDNPVTAQQIITSGKFEKYHQVARQYGRSVTSDGVILSPQGKDTNIRIVEKNKRMRVESKDGKLLFSAPSPKGLESFFKDYWGDVKLEEGQIEQNNQSILIPNKEVQEPKPALLRSNSPLVHDNHIENLETESNANSIQTKGVSSNNTQPDPADATTGNRNSEPLDDGVATTSGSPDQDGRISQRPEKSGRTGTDSVQQRAEPSSSTPRDSGTVRTGRSTTVSERESELDPATAETSDKPVLDADFNLQDEDIGKGGLRQKYNNNIATIKILKILESENRIATPEERKQIAQYTGWGALKGVFDKENKQWPKEYNELKSLLTDAEYAAARASTLNAHYTSKDVVNGIISIIERLGFKSGRVLEPSVGTGNFFGLMPAGVRKKSELHGVELDPITSQIVAALYPSAKIAKATGFQDFQVPAEYFDLVIGNPPFGNEPIVDNDRSPYSGSSIHNYFFAKSIDKLRPGGLLAMVVSHNFMDARLNNTRKWIAERADLVAAVRLPNTAFKQNAGTEVVTDIIVLRKRNKDEPSNGVDWVETGLETLTNTKTGEESQHNVNNFFINNPKHILGEATASGSMYKANEYTVESWNHAIGPLLGGWVEQYIPENIYQPISRTDVMTSANYSVPDGVKAGSFFINDKGDVLQRGEDELGSKTAQSWLSPNNKAMERMKGMIALRDILRDQMRLEKSLDADSQQIEANRKKLNELYDQFHKNYGYLNNQTNRRIFLDDTESALVQALEFDYDRGVSKLVAEREEIEQRPESATKADIFKMRVLFPPTNNIKVHNANDALLASLNYKGTVDLNYMAGLYDKPVEEIVSELGDAVYKDPIRGVVMSDEYLSGDVKTKLEEAQAIAKNDPEFKRNVDALKKVIPKDKLPSEIHATLGANFIPVQVYQQFTKEVTGADFTFRYLKATGQWISTINSVPDTALNVGKWGIEKMPATEILTRTMAGQGVVVTHTVKMADGSTRTVVLEKETEAAREKQAALKAEWQRWLWADPDRAESIATIYNDKMNRIVNRKFDGSHLTFPGMNPVMALLPHQKNAVWRMLQDRQVLLDHVVGAGKTFEIVTAFMEMRRLGIARKPFIAVPNHLTLQWRSEFNRLYPGSNILAATPDDFSKGNREKFFSKMITGDWDAVIVGHSSLKKIALPPETEKAVLEEQIHEITTAIEEIKRDRGDRNIIRDMENIRTRLQNRMKERIQNLGERDKVVTFDELGADAFAVDELHEFKNLFYNTTMQRVPGMGNPKGSDKAFDLFVKLQWMFNTFGDDNAAAIGATGTPVSNSLVEMFNMQRLLQYPTLKANDLHIFDAWAKQFGSVESVYEVSPSGTGFRQSNRFSKFKNLPALMALYNSFADTVTLDDLKAQEIARGKTFPVPKIVGGRPQNVVAKRSEQVADFMGTPELEMLGSQPVFQFDPLNGDTFAIVPQDNGSVSFSIFDEDGGVKTAGISATEDEARLALVEYALTPKIFVDEKSILGQFNNLKRLTQETKGKINALSLTGQANKAGLDYRLIDPTAPDFKDSKINKAVANTIENYHKWNKDKGTQLIFCDMSIPLSARSGFANKERRVYVRNDGNLVHKKGTMHTIEGHEDIPFFVIKEGSGKDKTSFAVYDALSGQRIKAGMPSKAMAIEQATQLIKNESSRQTWIDAIEQTGEIEQEAIDEYNNEHEIDAEATESITRDDIAGSSGATQFSVYDDIKAKLVAQGIPEREIAFIHDYNTPSAKEKLFKAVNSGAVRILLGSTQKMGAGTNVQQRLVTLHHIDAPWKPSDLEQREGRIVRRGNKLYERDPENFEVAIYRYATEQTYDTRRWQILEHKARGIEQLRNYDGSLNEIDDIEGEAANAADMKAAASGDPLILEETQLRNEVRRLETLQSANVDEKQMLRGRIRQSQRYINETVPSLLDEYQSLIDTANKHPVPTAKDSFVGIKINGRTYNDRENAVKAIESQLKNAFAGQREVIFNYRGISFSVENIAGRVLINAPTEQMISFDTSKDNMPSASGMLTRLANYIGRLNDYINDVKQKVEDAKKQIESMLQQLEQPFAQSQDLINSREAHKRVQRRLIAKGPDIPAHQKPILENALNEQRSELEKQGLGDALKEFEGLNGKVYSRGQSATRTDTTAKQVRDKLASRFGEATISKLEKDGKLNILDTYDEAGIEGFYQDGKVTLVADALTDDTIIPTFLHELGGHAGLQGIMKPETYQNLMDSFNRMVDAGNPVAIEAKRRAEAETDTKTQQLEYLPYLLTVASRESIGNTNQRGAISRFINRVKSAIKAFLVDRFNVKLNLTPDDIVALAERMIKKVVNNPPQKSNESQFSLNEKSHAPFQKAIDDVIEGNTPTGFINMGSTPDVLKMLGLPDAKVSIKGVTIEKVMGEHLGVAQGQHSNLHNLTPETLRQIPKQLNDPIAIFKSAQTSTNKNSYVILTELTEIDSKTGAEKPVIVALELDTTRSGIQIATIRSIYGRSLGQMQTAIDGDVLYWHKQKGQQFINAFGLQLSSKLRSDAGLSSSNIKTNEDLVKYQSGGDKPLFSRAAASNPQNLPRSRQREILDAVGKTAFGQMALLNAERAKTISKRTGSFFNTMLHKALQNNEFKKTFDLVQNKINHVTYASSASMDVAPGILTQLETLDDYKTEAKNVGKKLAHTFTAGKVGRPQNEIDLEKVGEILFTNTLSDDPKVYKVSELQALGFTASQIELYRQARKAIDTSLDEFAKTTVSNIFKHFGGTTEEILELTAKNLRHIDHVLAIKSRMNRIVANEPDKAEAATIAEKHIDDVLDKLGKLKKEGYMPLMRFGKYYFRVIDPTTKTVAHRQHFESEAERNMAVRNFDVPDGYTIESSEINELEHTMFQGVSPETLALFAKEAGLPTDNMQEAFIKHAVRDNHALKRLLRRKGIQGFNEDTKRVIAAFVLSNSRYAANQLFNPAIDESIIEIKDPAYAQDAIRLRDYALDPKEEISGIKNFSFVWYMGASFMFGVVNLTQPFLQTLPYLLQYSKDWSVTGKAVLQAGKSWYGKDIPAKYRVAYERARKEGHLDPQNTWMLQGLERGKSGLAAGTWQLISHASGFFAQASETVNRRAALFASLDVAEQLGQAKLEKLGFKDGYDFAVRTIQETQGIYNKGNRPRAARGNIASMLMMYKQFMIAYVEQMVRMQRSGLWGGEDDEFKRKMAKLVGFGISRSLLVALGVLWSFAGATGLPFVRDMLDAIETAGGMVGKPFNTEREVQIALHTALGDTLGESTTTLLLDGPVNLNPVLDVKGRMGMGDLIPGTAYFSPLTSEYQKSKELMNVGGAVGGLLEKVGDAMDFAKIGSYGQAATQLAPKAVTSLGQGSIVVTTGDYRNMKTGVKTNDASVLDGIVKALDAQPATIAKEGRIRGLEMKDKAAVQYNNKRAKEEYEHALESGNLSEIVRVKQKIKDYNDQNPRYPITLNLKTTETNFRKSNMSWQEKRKDAKGLAWMDSYNPYLGTES